MSRNQLLLGTLSGLALSSLLAFSPRGDALRFQVAEGTELSRSMQIGMSINMDGGMISFMGEEQELPADDEDPLEVDASIEVSDSYTKMGDGVVQVMTRTYDSFAIEVADSEDPGGDMEIEGETVTFTRDEEGNYVKTMGESGEESSALDSLSVDMDMTLLLPSEEVDAGAEWELKGESLRGLFLPGGIPGSDDADSIEAMFSSVAIPMLTEGAEDIVVNCTYVGTEDKDDVQIAEISFKFEGSTGGDATDLMLAIGELEGDSGMPEDIEADASIDFEGEGTLLWNVKAGHAHAFEMVVEPSIELSMDVTQDMGDQTIEMEMMLELSGEISWEMSVE